MDTRLVIKNETASGYSGWVVSQMTKSSSESSDDRGGYRICMDTRLVIKNETASGYSGWAVSQMTKSSSESSVVRR